MAHLTILDRKLVRDLGRLWAQILAVALVMACGVATLVLSLGAYRSLEETRATFYDRYRFADVFASAERAPMRLADRIANIPGVARSQFRIVRSVVIDVEGMREPASGIAVSLPDHGEPALNRLYVRSGRLPLPGRQNEIAVIESFAKAHGFGPGDAFSAILNGRKQKLTITGVVLSPEYVYAIGPGDIVPTPSRFAVFFMPRSALEGLFDMDGAFNDVALSLRSGAQTQDVMDRVDRLLEPFGGRAARARKDQTSNAFLDSELTELKAMAFVIPPIFLFVAAFLVNMILSRLIALEREQIGLLKAVGYGRMPIAWHYSKLVIAMAFVGLAIGSAAGAWLGRGMAELYSKFFSFPFLVFRESPDLYAIAGFVTVGAALAGAARAIFAIVALPPAVAMRPPAPVRYRRLPGAANMLKSVVSPTTTMAMRHLMRWPLRAGLTTLGISFSVALLVTAWFSTGSINFMIETLFYRAERQDATIAFFDRKAPSALDDARHLPGTIRAEPFRQEPAILRNGQYERQISIEGLPPDSDLTKVLDIDLNHVTLPSGGLLLSERVADVLHLRPGDMATLELIAQNHRVVQAPVSAVVQSYIGLSVYMDLDALHRLAGDGERLSGVRVSVDANALPALYRTIKETPAVGSISLLDNSRLQFRRTIEDNITIMTTVYIVLAVIITFGVIYNSARIQLAEHARELASLRVLGFTRGEASSVLLIELAILIALAQPLGWILGYGFSWSVVQGFDSDLFRIPLVIEPSTFAKASLVVMAAGIVSSLIVRRRVDRLDLVRVLKTRE
ncbi:MAG: ABC transporter permease [Rhodobiaceae bacterium]|nr:ABC transporter permease [Rhodobiaceae bacterium]MCC0054649.1 ABC transporter permease [Rhodobiaceae bacterium]